MQRYYYMGRFKVSFSSSHPANTNIVFPRGCITLLARISAPAWVRERTWQKRERIYLKR